MGLSRCIVLRKRYLGRRAVLVQEDAQFHPGWFDSNVDSISLDEWISLTDLAPSTDRVIIPETCITVINKYTSPKVVLIKILPTLVSLLKLSNRLLFVIFTCLTLSILYLRIAL